MRKQWAIEGDKRADHGDVNQIHFEFEGFI